VNGRGALVTDGSLRVLFQDGYGYVVQVAGGTHTAICGFDRDGRDIAPGGPGDASTGSGNLPTESAEAVSATEWGNGSTGLVALYYPDSIPFPGPTGPDRIPSPGAAGHVINGSLDTRYASGVLRRDVARLKVTWAGAAPVWAAVEGPFWLARAALPPGAHDTATPADVVAYDRDGNVVGRTRVGG
jgi:hypothetical protein